MPPVPCVESLHRVFHGRGAKGAQGLSMGRVIPCGPGLRSPETRTKSSTSLGGSGYFGTPHWCQLFHRLKARDVFITWSTMLSSAEVINGDVRLNDNSGTYMRIYVDGDDLKFKDRQGNVMTFSKPACTHTITEFDTNAIAGESSDGYTNNNQFFSISGSGSTAEVAIVITGTWKCDGVSRTANRYVKRAPTNVYKRGWNDCRSGAMDGTPMYDGAGHAYYRLPSAI